MSQGRSAHAWERAGPLPSRQCVLWALVWALLLAPALGRWHETLHGAGSRHAQPGRTAAWAQGANAQPTVAAPKESSFLESLFSGHTRSDCLLLDQATLAYALPSTGLALPAAAPQACALPAPPERVARWHVALFHARGPPAPQQA